MERRLTGLDHVWPQRRSGLRRAETFDREWPKGLIKAFYIAKKDAKVYYFKAPNFTYGLLIPISLFLAFAMAEQMNPKLIVPGLVSLMLLFGTTSIEAVAVVLEKQTGAFERESAEPESLNADLARVYGSPGEVHIHVHAHGIALSQRLNRDDFGYTSQRQRECGLLIARMCVPKWSLTVSKVRGLANVASYALYSLLCLVLNREAAENIRRPDKAVSPTYFNK